MTTAVELHTFELFCYTCKQYITVTGEDKKQASARFRQSGHSDDKVPALAPDFGRTSQRYERAIAGHRARELALKQRNIALAKEKEAKGGTD